VPTHALGDAYADDVIAGRIPRARAEETQRETEQAARGLSRARLWRG
jgi:hypothetical protein